MAYQPIDEDRAEAEGRHFGVRLAPFVTCDVLAVRGVRMRNTRLVAVVSVIRDDVRGEWSASLAYAEREELGRELDDEDGA
jgi:hypothetical protein